ncbi:NADH dehydrogenase [ubiquinone] iron-sulfur protein 4, mitochondrial-like [Corticium candelabrum]|uniref:NADH dehydrogenase [ubiquinone] iron-sulfur protein 4, mitochondrial-like n=1 Tax=Corticium candelabrum TaxID=121492 RepID=UPI002E2555AF|nr:NADH dehydrogenase [ubiquinone] iron-sulfur protein 4, mitochondrial-like [Corticium candelabrum]
MAAVRQFGRSLAVLRRARFISTVTALTEVDKENKGALQDVPLDDFGAIAPVTGFPEEHRGRRVRIYAHSRNAMQSGTHASLHWRLDFDVQERWENPLIGWASTADPVSNVHIEFETVDEAVTFAKKNGWLYEVDKKQEVKPKWKSYGDNFSWNRKTRVTTK